MILSRDRHPVSFNKSWFSRNKCNHFMLRRRREGEGEGGLPQRVQEVEGEGEGEGVRRDEGKCQRYLATPGTVFK